MASHEQSVQQQFDSQAQAYLTSAVHAQGPDLAEALRRVEADIPRDSQGLDVGCGAGHLSFMLAQALDRVVALDPSAGMLATVAEAAAARGLHQIQTRQGSAGSLPFEDGAFGLVGTRYSAHHWLALPACLRELHRVLKPGGRLLLIDITGDADPLVDTHLQAMEVLRDPSHVRNHSIREWQALLSAAGLAAIEHQSWPTPLQFTPWVERMRTPAARVAAIRELQGGAPAEVKAALRFAPDGSFTATTTLFWARRPA